MEHKVRYDLMKDVPAAGVTFPKIDVVNLTEQDDNVQKDAQEFNCNSIRFGSTPIQLTESDPLNRQPLSELAEYFQAQKESIYRRNRREPFGKSYSYGTHFPDHIANNPEFSFGKKGSQANHSGPIFPDESGTKWCRKTDPEGIVQEQLVQKKIDFKYDWAKAGIDPDKHRFGYRIKEQVGENRPRCFERNRIETTRITLRCENDMQERYRQHRLGQAKIPPTYLVQMDKEHRFGILPNVETNGTAEECLRYEDDRNVDKDIGRRIWQNSAPQHAEAMVHGVIGPVQNQRNTARACIWPVDLDNDFIVVRELQQILDIWGCSGLDSESPIYTSTLEYFSSAGQQKTSLNEFMTIYNEKLMSARQEES